MQPLLHAAPSPRTCDENGGAVEDAVQRGAVEVALLAVVEVHRVHDVLPVRRDAPDGAADGVPRRVAPQPQPLTLACLTGPTTVMASECACSPSQLVLSRALHQIP